MPQRRTGHARSPGTTRETRISGPRWLQLYTPEPAKGASQELNSPSYDGNYVNHISWRDFPPTFCTACRLAVGDRWYRSLLCRPPQRTARQRPPSDAGPAEEGAPGPAHQERNPEHATGSPPSLGRRRTAGLAGYWEVDPFVGKRQGSAIGTPVDRATRYTRLIHLIGASQVRDTLVTHTAGWPVSLRRRFIWEQGRELCHQEEIEELTCFRPT